MDLLLLPHVVVYFALASVCVGVAIVAWQRRQISGAGYLTLAMLCSAWWGFCAGMEAGVIGESAKIAWSKIEYIGYVNISPLLVLFIAAYTNRGAWIRWKTAPWLWVFPVITLVLAWTNEQHSLIWNSFTPSPDGVNVLVYGHGAWFWVYSVYYYLLFIVMSVMLITDLKSADRPYRSQYIVILLAVNLPAFAGIFYISPWNPIQGLDWAPMGIAAAGVIYSLGIYRLHLFDLVPVARSALFEQSINSIFVLDKDKCIVDANRAAQDLVGISAHDLMYKSAPTVLEPLFDVERLRFEDPICRVEAGLKNSPGCFVEIQVSHLLNRGKTLVGWLMVVREITDRKQVEIALTEANQRLFEKIVEIQLLQDQLREQATKDVLTGLHNRRYLGESLEEEFLHARRDGYPVSLMMIDMDTFKDLNDLYGHKAGDMMLETLGKLIRDRIRRSDIACRYGGDEFLLVLPGMDAQDAQRRAEEWRQAFEAISLKYGTNEIRGTISIGVAVFPEHGSTVDEVICAADEALYQAKAAGRNRVMVKSTLTETV
ncbi:MAG TPA: histidine kinase N-terminal 7TM domain-containing protein [Anaerolineaceae bacterium]|nr:histidine kinase N-terminal 7TM domain-containing protein [Anaerolineaceae bacterium]